MELAQAPLHYAVSTTGATAKVDCDASRLEAGILRFDVSWDSPGEPPANQR